MPAGSTVRPKKWKNIINLYDDGNYSAVWGNYEGSKRRCLGVRWNNSYPSQGKYPVWYVEPEFLTKCLLLEMANSLKKNPKNGNIKNINIAISERS
jgi:hypothetical protein